MANSRIVSFDTETTGFEHDDEIIQIAACTRNTIFDIYITPTKQIHPQATLVNGLELINGHLYLNGKKVRSFSARTAFKHFLDYLESIGNGSTLIAHNCFGFDMPRILALAEKLGFLNKFKILVEGFSDSLIIFRSVLSQRRAERRGFKLIDLVRDYMPEVPTNNLHNAKWDAEILLDLLDVLQISDAQIIQSAKSIDKHYYEKDRKSLQFYNNILSPHIINKMASYGINRKMLWNVYEREGPYGIEELLSKNVNGRPRVTSNSNIIDELCYAINYEMYG